MADAVLPLSYSVHASALHRVLRWYKRAPRSATRRLHLLLAALLWRFLAGHEGCLARAAGVPAFERVCTVPSGRRAARHRHPLNHVLAAIDPLAARFDPSTLRASETPAHRGRRFDPLRFACPQPLEGQAVLLVDDTWTTGASAQSAAAALKRAGARAVGVLVIARHIRAEYADNEVWLAENTTPFDWHRCALC